MKIHEANWIYKHKTISNHNREADERSMCGMSGEAKVITRFLIYFFINYGIINRKY